MRNGSSNPLDAKPPRNPRRLLFGVNAGVALALAAALLLMANYLSYRHYRRWDWSRSHYYSLSEKTLNLLNTLTSRVDVVVFFQPGQDVYEDVDNLLKEYEYACPKIRVVRVDPDRDLARTEELKRTYDVDQANVVVFDSNGRSKYVTAGDMGEYDYSPVQMGQQPVRIGFKGEQAFSSAIHSVTHARKPVVYFLQGHGERDIDNFSRSGGFSSCAQEVRRDNIEVKTLTLGESASVPADCDALVIAGPDKALSVAEVAVLRNYLDQKGRLMVLQDAATRTGLEPLLADWGIKLAGDVVVDPTRTLTGRELFVTKYGPHPITLKLRNVTSIFYLPRSVEPAAQEQEEADPDKPQVVSLAKSSESGWAENDLTQSPMKYDQEMDRPGPVSIAVAAERGPVPGINMQIRPTRIVVFGDSDFLANGAMTGGNADFFLNALNWLLDREELMGIAAKPVEQNRLVMNDFELRLLFWIVVIGLPGMIGILGGLVWMRRRA